MSRRSEVTFSTEVEFVQAGMERHFPLEHKSLLAELPIGVYCATADGEITWANDVLLRTFGCSTVDELNAICAKSQVEFCCHRQSERSSANQHDQTKAITSRFLLDDTVITVRENLRAVRDDDGQTKAYIGTVEEIASKNIVDELDGEDLLTALMESTPDTIYFKDTASRFLRVNKAQASLLGLASPVDAIGKSDHDFFTGDHATDAFNDEQLLMESRQPVIDKLERIRRADGEFRWVSATKVPMLNATGEVIGIAGISRDITDRKIAELERQVLFRIMQGASSCVDLHEQLKLIHEAISEVIDARNCFVTLLDEATKLMHFEFYVDAFDEKPAPLPMNSGLTGLIFKKNKPMLLNVEQQNELTKRGEADLIGSVSAAWLGVPLRTPTAVIGALVVQNYDDPNAYTQKDLEFLTSVGSQIAMTIERKMAQDRLQRTAEQLSRSNRELQDFASIASHDLQEPLRKIRAFGDRLKSKCAPQLTDDGRDYLDRMQNAAERMQILINDLLTFSRVTTKAQPFAPVNLNVIVNDVLSDLEVRIEEVGAAVTVTGLPTIDADPLQMRQLLQNLIANALKFRKADQRPEVNISAQAISIEIQSNSWSFSKPHLWQISIADNGIGFDEKYLDRIFTVFQRLHGRNTYEGTGVGLAVCRRIAERHNGSITAKSEPGNGATFIVTLPANQIKEQTNE